MPDLPATFKLPDAQGQTLISDISGELDDMARELDEWMQTNIEPGTGWGN